MLIPTSLELPLVREGDTLRIDLADLPIFFGLSILSRDIGEKIINRYHLDRIDIEVEKKVKRSETPELAALQIENIKVAGDYEVFDNILADENAFFEDLTGVFGTLQMQRWRKHIYPEEPDAVSKALVFIQKRRLKSGEYPFRVILERLRSSKKPEKYFLRAIFEGLDRKRLDLSSFPHIEVDNPEGRTFIAGATRVSRLLCQQVRWQAQLGKRTYSEIKRADSFIFGRLAAAGLDRLDTIQISWTQNYIDLFRLMEPDQLAAVFKKTMLLLEDHTVRRLLADGEPIRVDLGDVYFYLSSSQLGRALRISFGHHRRSLRIDPYLHRMPALEQVVKEFEAHSPLRGINVLLIHHITAEVLGFIAALRRLGAPKIFTLFVHYGEDVPSDFLEALLNLDQERFRCYCLNNVEEALSVGGYFVLSPRFSNPEELRTLDRKLQEKKPGYLQSMVDTATRLFLEMLLQTILDNSRLIVVEDGGYLTPAMTEKALAGASLADLLKENGVPIPAGQEQNAGIGLSEVLDRWLLGTVEHTKNGLDRLEAILNQKGTLARPAYSIAISKLKVTEEASEVAASILSAIESVLHAQGKVLSRRKVAVIGANGSIGRCLVSQLGSRGTQPDSNRCLEVDIRTEGPSTAQRGRVFATRFQDLPRELLLDVDLVIGVTGQPAFLWDDMEMLLVGGTASSFYLVSGSTKTIEFEDVSERLERLLKVRNPTILGKPCRIEGDELNDPQTGRLLGYTCRFTFKGDLTDEGKETQKEICFLGNLMPINFLYYGVPGEVMGLVLCQLLRCSIGLVQRARNGVLSGKSVWAVDRDIDVDGQPLSIHALAGR